MSRCRISNRWFLKYKVFFIFVTFIAISVVQAAVPENISESIRAEQVRQNELLREKLRQLQQKQRKNQNAHFIFDIPVTYNTRVSKWITHFQTRGSVWFREWLERSYRYLPLIQSELKHHGMPMDLAYMVMIESGFSAKAVSVANAVGPWQFIESTGSNYGLKRNWWLDERRDLKKATIAAIKYLKDLHDEFGSWYLVAASYNMGEGGLRKRIKKYKTRDYWALVKLGALPQETQDYVPKILAGMLIAKAPSLYGFRELERQSPLTMETIRAPGGTDLEKLADHIGVTRKALKDINAELLLGYIPKQVDGHYIRIPKGTSRLAREFFTGEERKVLVN